MRYKYRKAFIRSAIRLAVALFVALFVALAVSGCENGGRNDPESARGGFAADGVPVMEQVRSVAVTDADTGNALSSTTDSEAIDRLLQGLREAEPASVGDPEPRGKQYKVVFAGSEGTLTVRVNDLRDTDSLLESAKVYHPGPDEAASGTEGTTGTGEPVRAWNVPSAWVRLLLGHIEEAAEPLLYVSAVERSASVVVQANRRVTTASVVSSIADTIAFSGLPEGAEPPRYRIHWSDPQRFVVRFDGGLPEGAAVRFRLDGAMSAEGESFAGADMPHRNVALLRGEPAADAMRWIGAAGDTVQTARVESAVLIHFLEENGQESLVAYHRDGSLSRLDAASGRIRTIRFADWPGAEASFGNDYGADVLLSDRAFDGVAYAVKGNRTLYRIDLEEAGSAVKLYESPTAVHGLAASPDGDRIALLVSPDADRLTADADLLVLDANGQPMTRYPKATFGAHSDGFLFAKPLHWIDGRTVAVPRYDGQRRVAYVNVEDVTARYGPADTLPEDALRLVHGLVGWEAEIRRIQPQPGGDGNSRYAVQAAGGGYMVDAANDRAVWLGPGEPLGWTGDGRLLVWESSAEATAYFLEKLR